MLAVTRSAAASISGAALPMATPVPACRIMVISFVPSPKARVSSVFSPSQMFCQKSQGMSLCGVCGVDFYINRKRRGDCALRKKSGYFQKSLLSRFQVPEIELQLLRSALFLQKSLLGIFCGSIGSFHAVKQPWRVGELFHSFIIEGRDKALPTLIPAIDGGKRVHVFHERQRRRTVQIGLMQETFLLEIVNLGAVDGDDIAKRGKRTYVLWHIPVQPACGRHEKRTLPGGPLQRGLGPWRYSFFAV